jgi:hypothetical protein
VGRGRCECDSDMGVSIRFDSIRRCINATLSLLPLCSSPLLSLSFSDMRRGERRGHGEEDGGRRRRSLIRAGPPGLARGSRDRAARPGPKRARRVVFGASRGARPSVFVACPGPERRSCVHAVGQGSGCPPRAPATTVTTKKKKKLLLQFLVRCKFNFSTLFHPPL